MKKLFLILLPLTFFACGEERTEEGVNESAVNYYYGFATHDEGKRLRDDLELSENPADISGNIYTTTARKFLRLDLNGTYFLYATNGVESEQFINSEDTQLRGIDGIWRVEDDRLVLEGIGESISFNSAAVNTFNFGGFNTEMNSSNCFIFPFNSNLNVPINGDPNVFGSYYYNTFESGDSTTVFVSNSNKFCKEVELQ